MPLLIWKFSTSVKLSSISCFGLLSGFLFLNSQRTAFSFSEGKLNFTNRILMFYFLKINEIENNPKPIEK
jgi:hypothetical protein